MYRIRPSVAHREINPVEQRFQNVSLIPSTVQVYFVLMSSLKLESCFLPTDPNVSYVPSQMAWDPFRLPKQSQAVNFVEGMSTIGGNGDPILKEGLAVHIFIANVSMQKTAFVNNDGDMLILPQLGRLDIQTELGWMMVRPGELAVIQAGIRFRVLLPDGPSRGYIQEVFGTHYELPELGPFGSNGMAYPRDFETPVASFDVDSTEWSTLCKLGGKMYSYSQGHTPFDVIAWHGNLAPYKYAIEKFVNTANVEKDQADPTIYCVLTARSKVPGVSISDFLAFTPRWATTTNTFRPPYYHRNMSTEVMGLIYGQYGGSSHVLEPGGLSYEASYMPHGESYTTWKDATTRELKHERIAEDTMAWMMHISVPLLLTDWAIKDNPSLHLSDPQQWNDVRGHFLDHLDEVNEALAAANLPLLGTPNGYVVPANMNGDR